MRSNLLSLQQIAKLQDSTQLRLSTGLKVNSAIDNPSSYYTASSLTNRAEDLSALLDSMGQSVQTIKAATEGIEKAEDLLSQMKAIAEQVNTGTYVPEKSYFEKLVGSNGTVVSTAEELRAAIDSGKEEICVYGKIDLGDISTTGGISLQENQKLVGVNYYGNYGSEGESFSEIIGTASNNEALVEINKNGCLVSDLNLNYVNTLEVGVTEAIYVHNENIIADLQNLNIIADFSASQSNQNTRAAILVYVGAAVNLKGNINIETLGRSAHGIVSHTNATVNVGKDALINIKTKGTGAYGFSTFQNSVINIEGNVQIETEDGYGFSNAAHGDNHINIGKTASIYLDCGRDAFFNQTNSQGGGFNMLTIMQGAKIAIEKDGNAKWYEVQADYEDKNDSGTDKFITVDNIETTLNVEQTSSWQKPQDIKEEQRNKEKEEQANRAVYQKQYNNALSQYDSLIKDSSYKGVNLLQADDLKVIFNENRSATLEVSGVDLSSDKIGMMTADWSKAKDVQNSINQIINAKNTLRSASTKLGNYYSIITERETFTDNLINVLQEGADKLTLADMNEESANMLSLQTQQQLAINSLSLASQASQAVLRLF